MKCKVCQTELERDLKRNCTFCPLCHPKTQTAYESKEEEIEFLKKRLAELQGTDVQKGQERDPQGKQERKQHGNIRS